MSDRAPHGPYFSCLAPYQGRFSHLKCPSPNRLVVRDDFLGLRRVRVEFEWVDAREVRDGWRPCQFIVAGADNFGDAFREVGRMMDLIIEKGTRFVPPGEVPDGA